MSRQKDSVSVPLDGRTRRLLIARTGHRFGGTADRTLRHWRESEESVETNPVVSTSGLEERCGSWLLCCMAESSSPRSALDRAFVAGSLATISTGGALIGLGMRAGESSRIFRLAGRGILEGTGLVRSAAPLTSVGVGYLHHLLVATLWGVLLFLCLVPLKGWKKVVGALAGALFYGLISLDLVPAGLRIGYSVTSNAVSAVPIGISLAVALLGSLWLAATDNEG